MAEKLQLTNLGKKQPNNSNVATDVAPCMLPKDDNGSKTATNKHKPEAETSIQSSIKSGVSGGFQIACESGPLCQAPLWGVVFDVAVGVTVPDFDFSEESWRGLNLLEGSLGPISGQVCRSAELCYLLMHELGASPCRRTVQ
jgi:hypothetical protein